MTFLTVKKLSKMLNSVYCVSDNTCVLHVCLENTICIHYYFILNRSVGIQAKNVWHNVQYQHIVIISLYEFLRVVRVSFLETIKSIMIHPSFHTGRTPGE